LQVAQEPVESELKIPVTDLASIRTALSDAGAVLRRSMAREINYLLDADDSRLKAAGSLLRLRRHAGTALLTFKGPATFSGAIKERPEYETEIEDLQRMIDILEHLGFTVFMRYEKDREEWLLERVAVVLDHTPMGDFVELEGPPERLEQVAESLGIDVAEAVHGSYISLWHDHRRGHPELDLPFDMVFTE
jgi:adenylate cyclase class 2